MSYFSEVLEAIQEAEQAQRAVQLYCDRMLKLCAGHLRGADPCYLKQIKHELQQFDMRTGEWK